MSRFLDKTTMNADALVARSAERLERRSCIQWKPISASERQIILQPCDFRRDGCGEPVADRDHHRAPHILDATPTQTLQRAGRDVERFGQLLAGELEAAPFLALDLFERLEAELATLEARRAIEASGAGVDRGG